MDKLFSWLPGDGKISFPAFGIEVDPPVGFVLFDNITIHFYGVLICIGMILAVIYGLRRRQAFGLKEDEILDGFLYIVPFAILCARAYYCIFAWDMYKNDPISVLYIWKGGIAIYGGVIGTALGIFVYCKLRKLSLGTVLDLVALGFLIGQSVGRWGNFINREAYGAATDSFLRMGLTHSAMGKYHYYHPTFLYESLWNLAGFILLHFLSKKRRYDGQIALGYVAWYGLGRSIIEGLRMDSLYLGPFRVSQLLAAVSCIAAVSILIWQHFRPHDPEKLYANAARLKNTEEVEKDEDQNEGEGL